MRVSVNFTQSLVENNQFRSIMSNFCLPEQASCPLQVGDLQLFEAAIQADSFVAEAAEFFNQNPAHPGMAVMRGSRFVGLITRERCFEALGRRYGIEIFLRKTADEFYSQFGPQPLVFQAQTPIKEAVKAALARQTSEIYDPMIVALRPGDFRILSMQTLLVAQSALMESLYQEVQKLSIIDPLTNVRNRRGFYEAAQDRVLHSVRTSADLSAIMVDIDHFKLINDVYGHFVGDRVIRTVAEEIQKSLRETDLLGRFGGEEFIILLPNTALDIAARVAERLRTKVEQLVCYIDGYEISVSVSVGVCHIDDTRDSLDNLFTQADQAMYAAKQAGRNRVTLWSSSVAHKLRKDVSAQVDRNRAGQTWWQKNPAEAARIYDETIEGWAHALELRDKETEGHAQRVTGMTVALARRMGFNEHELVHIRRGAMLHDIGKIAVPDSILFKPTALNDEEWAQMRKHPVYAFELLSPITFLQKSVDIPYCHHEHWDGSGYPRGLKGEEIPLAARIFTIIDVWDALSTDRCYRKAWPPSQVWEYLRSESGKLLDPGVVTAFLKMWGEESGQEMNQKTDAERSASVSS